MVIIHHNRCVSVNFSSRILSRLLSYFILLRCNDINYQFISSWRYIARCTLSYTAGSPSELNRKLGKNICSFCSRYLSNESRDRERHRIRDMYRDGDIEVEKQMQFSRYLYYL